MGKFAYVVLPLELQLGMGMIVLVGNYFSIYLLLFRFPSHRQNMAISNCKIRKTLKFNLRVYFNLRL